MVKTGSKITIGTDYGNELPSNIDKLIGTRYTHKQVESLMNYIGKEETEDGSLLVFRTGSTVYKFKVLPEVCPDVPINLMELCDIERANERFLKMIEEAERDTYLEDMYLEEQNNVTVEKGPPRSRENWRPESLDFGTYLF